MYGQVRANTSTRKDKCQQQRANKQRAITQSQRVQVRSDKHRASSDDELDGRAHNSLELESFCVVSSRFDTLSSDCSITLKTVKNVKLVGLYTRSQRVDKRNMSVHPYRFYDT